jgi:large subunit ribosomal protein L23
VSRPSKPLSSVADLRRMTDQDIIKRPIVTEQSLNLSAENKYTFDVDLRANKIEIRNAVQNLFKVKVVKVTTSILPGKQKRRGRVVGMTSERKRAVVTLAEGHQIQIDNRPLYEA